MSTETTTVLGTISANDVKALRTADTVSFHHYQDGGEIRASKWNRSRGPFDDCEKKYSIAVLSSFAGKFTTTADDDDETGERVTADNSACFAMEHCASYSEEWQTVAHFLRAGDVLTLHWCADGIANGYFKGATVRQSAEVGAGMLLYADTLRLKVKRGEKRFSFFLDVSICPNNSARMIRRR